MPARDVIFNLKIQAGSRSSDDLRQFADDAVKTQRRIDESARNQARRQASDRRRMVDEEERQRLRMEDRVAQHHLRTELRKKSEDQRREQQFLRWRESVYATAERKDYEFRKRLRDKELADEKKRIDEVAAWRARVRANSARLEQAEAIRQRRADERALTIELRRSDRALRISNLYDRRREGATRTLLEGGGNIARGAVYTGLAGEDNAAAILGTVAAIEGGRAVYQGGKAVVGAIGTLKSGGALVGAAAEGAGLATASFAASAIAALAASALAAVTAFDTVRDTFRFGFGQGATPGSASDRIASGQLSFIQFLQGFNSDENLKKIAESDPTEAFGFARLGVASAQNEIRRRKYEAERVRLGLDEGASEQDINLALRVEQQEKIRRLGSGIRELGREKLGRATTLQESTALLREFGQDFRRRSAQGTQTEDVTAAADNVRLAEEQVLRLQREQHTLALQTARERVEGSRQELQNLTQAHREAQQLASALKRGYEGDIARAALSSPEDQARLREIARKQRTGETLTREETSLAFQYNQFDETAQKSAEQLARRAGIFDLFAPQREAVAKAEKDVLDKAKAISKAELTLKQDIEVVHKLESKDISKVLDKGWDEVKALIIKEHEDRIKSIETSVKAVERDVTRNRYRPPL